MSIKTEYQRHFYGEKDDGSYLCRLNFRKNRISQERNHTPLIWIDEDTDKNDENMDKDNKTMKEDSSNKAVVVAPVETISKTICDAVPTNVDSGAQGSNNEENSNDVNITVTKTRDVATQSPSKIKASKQRRPLKPVNRKKTIEHEKPIIAYGWADKNSLQAKKTFNVKAPKSEVRTSALRAATHQDLQRKIRLTGKEKLRREKLRKQEVIDALTNFDQWETEYKRQFTSR